MRAADKLRGPAGFTLIEILVVLVIIAVLTTVAVLSVGVLGTDRGLEAEGERYADVVQAALEQAQLEGRDFGVRFAANHYEVLAYAARRQRWESVPNDRLYAEHELPPGVVTELELEGKVVRFDADQPGARRVPQVYLYSSGDASPYQLRFGRDGSDLLWRATGQADGTLKVTRPGEEPAP